MDVQSLKNQELIMFAFNMNAGTAEDAVKVFFPNPGEHFAMDCTTDSMRDRLKAAIEIDRRIALATLKDGCSSPSAAKALIQRVIGSQEHESFWVVFMDSQHKVQASREVGIGTVTQCSVYPREIVKTALQLNSSAVFLAHNHPSGECKPSSADISLTNVIKSALALVDVRVLDHFVMSKTNIASMAELGLF